jgi:hypothetical protein
MLSFFIFTDLLHSLASLFSAMRACRFLPSLCHYAASRQLREREQEWERVRAQEAAGKRARKANVAPCSMRIMQACLKTSDIMHWVRCVALLHPFL